MGTCIAKCTPSLGNVSIFWARCSECVLWENTVGKTILYLRDGHGGEIAEVRNAIVDAAFQHSLECEPVSHLLWIDDDVLVFPGLLLELLHQHVDICSGVYFTKHPDDLGAPLIYPRKGEGPDRFRPNQAYDVWGHGMGATLVKLDVYRRMFDELKLPPDKYGRPSWYHTTNLSQEVRLDERGIVGTGDTEDLHFLDNAAKVGYQPRVVTTKHAFGFHYQAEVRNRMGKVIKEEMGYPMKQWRQWIAGEKIRWDTPEGEVVWD